MAFGLDFSFLVGYTYVCLRAFLYTIILTVVTCLFGTTVGCIWGIILASQRKALLELRLVLSVSADVVKGIPPLVLLLLFNYCIAPTFAIKSIFWIASSAFAINLAAFVADVVRSALVNVDKSVINAAKGLGMSPGQVTRHVIMPLAVRPTIPALALLCIHILKMTSLASILSYPELTYVGANISSVTFRPLEPLLLITAFYLLAAVPFSWVQRHLERSLDLAR